MKHAIREIVGKRIRGFIIGNFREDHPTHIFIVFTDDTSIELWISGGLKCGCSLDQGGIKAARHSAEMLGLKEIFELYDESITD